MLRFIEALIPLLAWAFCAAWLTWKGLWFEP